LIFSARVFQNLSIFISRRFIHVADFLRLFIQKAANSFLLRSFFLDDGMLSLVCADQTKNSEKKKRKIGEEVGRAGKEKQQTTHAS
jgi:hypothetical protein